MKLYWNTKMAEIEDTITKLNKGDNMRKVILSIMVSADGFMEAKNPNYNWHNWNEEMSSYMFDFFKRVDTFIYGRKSYEDMIAYWPQLNDDFAQIMNKTPKLVLSRTLKSATWNASIINKNASEVIQNKKMMDGKDMVLFAGADIADFFINNNLIDEYRLIVNPILLGGGKPLFKERDGIKDLKLKESVTFECGNVLLVYEPKT
jgi:dihydrofolate reductase